MHQWPRGRIGPPTEHFRSHTVQDSRVLLQPDFYQTNRHYRGLSETSHPSIDPRSARVSQSPGVISGEADIITISGATHYIALSPLARPPTRTTTQHLRSSLHGPVSEQRFSYPSGPSRLQSSETVMVRPHVINTARPLVTTTPETFPHDQTEPSEMIRRSHVPPMAIPTLRNLPATRRATVKHRRISTDDQEVEKEDVDELGLRKEASDAPQITSTQWANNIEATERSNREVIPSITVGPIRTSSLDVSQSSIIDVFGDDSYPPPNHKSRSRLDTTSTFSAPATSSTTWDRLKHSVTTPSTEHSSSGDHSSNNREMSEGPIPLEVQDLVVQQSSHDTDDNQNVAPIHPENVHFRPSNGRGRQRRRRTRSQSIHPPPSTIEVSIQTEPHPHPRSQASLTMETVSPLLSIEPVDLPCPTSAIETDIEMARADERRELSQRLFEKELECSLQNHRLNLANESNKDLTQYAELQQARQRELTSQVESLQLKLEKMEYQNICLREDLDQTRGRLITRTHQNSQQAESDITWVRDELKALFGYYRDRLSKETPSRPEHGAHYDHQDTWAMPDRRSSPPARPPPSYAHPLDEFYAENHHSFDQRKQVQQLKDSTQAKVYNIASTRSLSDGQHHHSDYYSPPPQRSRHHVMIDPDDPTYWHTVPHRRDHAWPPEHSNSQESTEEPILTTEEETEESEEKRISDEREAFIENRKNHPEDEGVSMEGEPSSDGNEDYNNEATTQG